MNVNSDVRDGKMICSQKRHSQNDMAGIRATMEEVGSAHMGWRTSRSWRPVAIASIEVQLMFSASLGSGEGTSGILPCFISWIEVVLNLRFSSMIRKKARCACWLLVTCKASAVIASHDPSLADF